jgi:cytoskeletal protein CcmA (bactofilin family)
LSKQEKYMFSKNNTSTADQEPTTPSVPKPQPQVQRPTIVQPAAAAGQQDMSSSLSPGMTVIGKLVGEGAVKIYGRIEGELQASSIVICEGAQIDGDVVAKELTIAGRVKGTIHAGKVKLQSSAVVEGDIFHRSLAIEENARFEGMSRREEGQSERPSAPGPAAEKPFSAATNGSKTPNGGTTHTSYSPPAA